MSGLSRNQVLSIAEKYGEFAHGDAQGHKRIDFAGDVIAAHKRIRDAAPELLDMLEAWQSVCERIIDQYGGFVVAGVDFVALGIATRAAIAKAKGEQA